MSILINNFPSALHSLLPPALLFTSRREMRQPSAPTLQRLWARIPSIWPLTAVLLLALSACVPTQGTTPDGQGEQPSGVFTPALATPSPAPMPSPTPTKSYPPVRVPQHLGIYYGWPSAAYADSQLRVVPAALFGGFDVVALGAGLAAPTHPEHQQTADLVKALTAGGIEVFGYVDMGMTTRGDGGSLDALQAEAAQWQQIGATGILWDDAGYEFAAGLPFDAYRARVAEIVTMTHEAGLKVFLNAWDPSDLFHPWEFEGVSLPAPALNPDDIVMGESWFVSEGRFVDPTAWQQKAERLATYRQQTPFRLACVATGDDANGVEDTPLFRAAYWAAVMYECDLFQYTNPHYSAATTAEGNRLTIHAMPQFPALDKFAGPVEQQQSEGYTEFARATNNGRIIAGSDGKQSGDGSFQLRGGNP